MKTFRGLVQFSPMNILIILQEISGMSYVAHTTFTVNQENSCAYTTFIFFLMKCAEKVAVSFLVKFDFTKNSAYN